MYRGLLRKSITSATLAASSYVGDSPLFMLDYLLRFLRVAVLLSIWRTILAGKGAVSGMTVETVLTYTLVSEVFAEQLAPRAGLEEAFWNGTVATRFLQPIGVVPQLAAEMAGRWTVGFALFSLPLWLAAPLLGVDPGPATPLGAAAFAFSLALGISVGLALDFLFAAVMIYFELGIWVLGQLRSAAGVLLSGALLPLALMPWGIGRVFALLPFASMASAPLRIYTGTGDSAALIALQALWSAALWPAAAWMWRLNRERMVSYGG